LLLPFVVHAAWSVTRGPRWEQMAVFAGVVALFAAGPRARRLFVGAYPIGLVGLLYDAMRPLQRWGVSPERVHLCDLRATEIALFGVRVDGQPATVHDWLQPRASRALDVLCAFPYGTFLFACLACAVWLYFRDYARMVRFGWCFFALNVAGFLTYHLYPAAPPWYYHAHGCQLDLLASASEGPNLARVDAWIGVPYFAGMYRRSSSVFGAMPSLHCAYPLLILVEGWSSFPAAARAAASAFFALMCFSAVYLDHHWICDAVAGVVYCLAVAGIARAAGSFLRERRRSATT
jgi:hypothetical protein